MRQLGRLWPVGHHERRRRVGRRSGQIGPDSLRDEGHDRMQQAQSGVEHVNEVFLRDRTPLSPAAQPRLAQLDVPVAKLVPEKAIECVRDLAELVGLQPVRDLRGKLGQPRENPRVGRLCHLRRPRLVAIEIHLHEACGVPNLRDKRAGGLRARRAHQFARLLVELRVELHILAARDKGEQVEAHRVGAVHLDQVHGVDAVALGFRHAAAVFGQDGRVDENVVERYLAREVDGAHDHARHPQRDDVACRNQHFRGVVPFQLLGGVRPALRGKGPQLAGKPGVEHVVVLPQRRTTLRAGVRILFKRVRPPAFVAVEHGDTVPPPQLARDTPVFQVFHPREVGLRPALRVKGNLPALDRLGGRPFQLVHSHEPLLG